MATFDAIISNGLVYDGTGSPPQQIDVGIKDGVIQAIGALGGEDCDQ